MMDEHHITLSESPPPPPSKIMDSIRLGYKGFFQIRPAVAFGIAGVGMVS